MMDGNTIIVLVVMSLRGIKPIPTLYKLSKGNCLSEVLAIKGL